MEVQSGCTAIFQPPQIEGVVQSREWLSFYPKSKVSSDVFEFTVPGTSTAYIDLNKSLVDVVVKITNADGTDTVTPIQGILDNFGLSKIFKEFNLSMQQKLTSTMVGKNYPYKVFLDYVTNYKEVPENVPSEWVYDSLVSRVIRAGHIRNDFVDSHPVQLQGAFHIDLSQQEKCIPPGVALDFKLVKNRDAFAIVSATKTLKFEIENIKLKICHVHLTPEMSLAHEKTLQEHDALYPYWQSVIKTDSAPKDSLMFNWLDVFSGQIPNEVIVYIGKAADYVGNYDGQTEVPYSTMELRVDGVSVPLSKEQEYTGSKFFALGYEWPPQKGFNKQVGKVMKFTLESDEIFGKIKQVKIDLDIVFRAALTEMATVVVYGRMASLMRIDKAKNVYI